MNNQGGQMVQVSIYKGVIDNYRELCLMVAEKIKNERPYSIKHLAEMIGVVRNTFYLRLKDKQFTPDQLEKLIIILN